MRRLPVLLMMAGLPCSALAQDVPPTPAVATLWPDIPQALLYTVPIVVLVLGVLVMLLVHRALWSDETWSLADALSEEANVTALDGNKPIMQDGKPLTIVQMRASSSRLIAMMGMVMILLMYLGFGTFALFAFGKTGTMPQSLQEVVTFLVAGMALFAPYVVNKFSSLFDGLLPKK